MGKKMARTKLCSLHLHKKGERLTIEYSGALLSLSIQSAKPVPLQQLAEKLPEALAVEMYEERVVLARERLELQGEGVCLVG
jgi:hypothetical protein